MTTRSPRPSASARQRHARWLAALTDLPTAPGLEDRVVRWIESWARARRWVRLRRDRCGNIVIAALRQRRTQARPIYITAHLDHPAFVVRRPLGPQELELEFRGGVRPEYFEGAALDVEQPRGRPARAVVTRYLAGETPLPLATARLTSPGRVTPGTIARWALGVDGPLPRVVDGRFYARACDDLAGVAAALATLDDLARAGNAGHVRVLLTRAEELGFIGAIGCCRAGTLPPSSRLICLETSRSFADSPIGAGPILRVGDRTGVFDATLTNQIAVIAARHAEANPDFRWQRKLMVGGTCEATAFTAFGYAATCVCLPLGNYHNMIDAEAVERGETTARLGPEFIGIDDFHRLVELLLVTTRQLDSAPVPFRARMDALFTAHHDVL